VSEPGASADHSSIERGSWLAQLPQAIADLKARWSLSIGSPWVDAGSCSWVAPVTRGGQPLVLKFGLPHMEARDEIAGLQYWNGDPTVRLVESDLALNALLLERCEPGRSLRERAEPEQDVVVADLLQRAWRRPSRGHSFRPLSVMLEAWAAETRDARVR
jgi:streptomycin 6-kinase